jgi:retron-type reverse transcriptase
MDLVRPDLVAMRHQANLAGAAAVEADRQRRAKEKEQKKNEAAERKQRRKEEIARRRATDIVFLGRGVSGRLGERESNQEKLAALDLPRLATPADLAQALGITIPQLRWLAYHNEVATRTHYIHFTVPKRSGGTRTLSAPHRKLAAGQQWILHNVLTKLRIEPCAHGFIPNRGTLTNAKQHTGRDVVVNMDLESFFPSIVFPRVRSVFQRAGYSGSVATILTLLCTECPRRQVTYAGETYFVATGPRGLPQGACTSPALSNQVARRLDKRLTGLAAKFGASYTRYADDLTISGGAELSGRVGYLMARVRHIAQEEGFAVNEKKSRVQRRNKAQTVTGLVVNDRPGVARAEVRRIRAILHRAAREGLEAQNREGRPSFRAYLQGKIAYVGMARPELGRKMSEQLKALNE